MGNITNGLKIKRIGKNNLLREITYGFNEKITEFICFIIKINDTPFNENYQAIQAKSNYIVHNFSIFNIVTKKEYKIKLESTNNKIFFLDIDVEFCKIPNLMHVLFVSNIIENSAAQKLKVKPNASLLIGREDCYFQRMEDISASIEQNRSSFIIYNFEKQKAKLLDFEKFRTENEEFKLGIECEIIDLEVFKKEFIDKQLDSVVKNEPLPPYFLNEKISEISPGLESSSTGNKSQESPKSQNYLDNKQRGNLLLESELPPVEMIKHGPLYSNTESELLHNNEIEDSNGMLQEDPIRQEESEKLILDDEANSNEDPKQDLPGLFKYSLKKPKARFTKILKIYENLDSHFNFLGANYKKETSEPGAIHPKSVILLKGFSLLNIDDGQNSNSILAINNLYSNLKIKFFQ